MLINEPNITINKIKIIKKMILFYLIKTDNILQINKVDFLKIEELKIIIDNMYNKYKKIIYYIH